MGRNTLKTKVKIELIIQTKTEKEYEDVIEMIDLALKNFISVKTVDIDFGEDIDD